MGRKIPGKKHRTVKDPYKQQAERFDAIKLKINNAPTRPDEQPIPRSFQDLFGRTGSSVTTSVKAKRRNVPKQYSKIQTTNPVSAMRRLDGESKKSFGMRINEAVRNLKGDKTFKDVLRETEGREEKSVSFKFKGKKRKAKGNDGPKLTKSQKLYIKEKQKRESIKLNLEFEKRCAVKRDVVEFGEVVHEPPCLKTISKKETGAPRPARRGLLLNSLFENDKGETSVITKGKKRKLPDAARIEAINAYREMKKMKMKMEIK